MIKIYGISTSRTLRPLSLLEEIGIEYEQISVDFRKGENRDPAFLAINPNGKLPALVDGDLILCESMAINLYLAKKYGGQLYPDNEADIARTNMWDHWVQGEVEQDLLTALNHRRLFAEGERDLDQAERAVKRLHMPFDVLETALQGKDYLLGNNFSVVDINVGVTMSWCKPARIRMDPWPAIKDWLQRCTSRPAFRAAIRKP